MASPEEWVDWIEEDGSLIESLSRHNPPDARSHQARANATPTPYSAAGCP